MQIIDIWQIIHFWQVSCFVSITLIIVIVAISSFLLKFCFYVVTFCQIDMEVCRKSKIVVIILK